MKEQRKEKNEENMDLGRGFMSVLWVFGYIVRREYRRIAKGYTSGSGWEVIQ